MLLERDGDGDRDRAKAIGLLDESLTMSSELGMRPLRERVLPRREILKRQKEKRRVTMSARVSSSGCHEYRRAVFPASFDCSPVSPSTRLHWPVS